jgi:tripartite-type tricarboxylate transporter receptor subunit TctC
MQTIEGRGSRARIAGLALLLLAAIGPLVPDAAAQAWPAKPVRLIVPWPPGTPADVAGRLVTDRMTVTLGQPMIVENRPGAAGTIGLGAALREPPDGYTVYMLSSPTLVAPLLFKGVAPDFLRDLQPVGHVAWGFNVLVVPVTSPAASLADLLAAIRANPGGLGFASGGNGTPAHLAGELFKQMTSTQSTHVPYNQFSQVIGDLVSGRVQFMFLTASAAIPQVSAGKLRALAVTGLQRAKALPTVATMAEQGFPGFVVRHFDGMAVRSGTPDAVVERLHVELAAALQHPAVQERFAALALEAEPMTPAKFAELIARESARWLEIGRAASIRAD